MADFTTLAHDWLVRVNDGFHRAEYMIKNVASQSEAYAEAAVRWARGEDRVPHGGNPDVPMPPAPSVDVARVSDVAPPEPASEPVAAGPLSGEEKARLDTLLGQEIRSDAEQSEMDALIAREDAEHPPAAA